MKTFLLIALLLTVNTKLETETFCLKGKTLTFTHEKGVFVDRNKKVKVTKGACVLSMPKKENNNAKN